MTELWDIRRKIKASAKKDKKNWLKGIIKEIEKAGNTGNSKKVFEQVKKLAGKQGSPPASLDGIDFLIFWAKNRNWRK